MQALVNEILQRIIHKAMALHAAEWGEQRRCNAHPHVTALPRGAGTGMTGMVGTFVNDF
jgi:hypothetical protein